MSQPVPSYRILVDGAATAGRAPVGDDVDRRATPWQRFRRLPALVKIAMLLVGFLFSLNLASGLSSIWFHWPSIPLLLLLLLYFSLRRKSDETP